MHGKSVKKPEGNTQKKILKVRCAFEGTVKSRLFHTKKRLKKLLTQEERDHFNLAYGFDKVEVQISYMAEWNMDSQEYEYSLFKFEDDLNADEQHPRIAHFQQKKSYANKRKHFLE